MKKTIVTTQQQRDTIRTMILNDETDVAHGYALGIGYGDGINAEFFEEMIKQDGLTMLWIKAVGTYYKDDIARIKEELAQARKND